MLFIRLISLLPLNLLYLISDVLSFFLRNIFKYRVKVVRANLAHAFPDKSSSEIRQIFTSFYKNLADFFVETIKLLSISRNELNQRVSIVNPEILLKHFRNNQPMLLPACHQFNWEWMVTAGRTHTGYTFTSVHRPLKSSFFEKLMTRVRTRFGGKLVPSSDLIENLKTRNEVTAYSMVMDHVSSKYHYWTTFLNRETLFDTSLDYMSGLTQWPVIYPKLRKVKRGYYQVELIPLDAPPYPVNPGILEKYIRAIEQSIQEQPETWLWTHRRWKHRKTVSSGF